jgi:hypothetical protein
MAMTEALHPAAIGLTAIAAALHPGWRRRASLPGMVGVLLMLAAMADAVFLQRITVVLWMAVLLAAGIGLSATEARRRRRGGGDAADLRVAPLHDGLGMVAMAALLPTMDGGVAEAGGLAHLGHGALAGGTVTLVLTTAVPHVLATAVASVRSAGASERLMHLLMGGATAVMAVHALVG